MTKQKMNNKISNQVSRVVYIHVHFMAGNIKDLLGLAQCNHIKRYFRVNVVCINFKNFRAYILKNYLLISNS